MDSDSDSAESLAGSIMMMVPPGSGPLGWRMILGGIDSPAVSVAAACQWLQVPAWPRGRHGGGLRFTGRQSAPSSNRRRARRLSLISELITATSNENYHWKAMAIVGNSIAEAAAADTSDPVTCHWPLRATALR